MDDLIKKHIDKFGIEPYIIGMFWNNQEQLLENIFLAIENNKPYNEYNLLSDDEKRAFDKVSLVF